MDLLWPGDHRAGDTFTGAHVIRAMVRVEQVWLTALIEVGIAPADCAAALPAELSTWGNGATSAAHREKEAEGAAAWVPDAADIAALAVAGEDAGNPAVPLVALLRRRLPEPAATWVHRGLTSQDVLDTALVLCLKDALAAIDTRLGTQLSLMTALVDRHRTTPMLARTLTQPATPSTFGVRTAAWLTGLLDAADALDACRLLLKAQIGGAAGTLAATTELAHGRGAADPAGVAQHAAHLAADRLGPIPATPWHTARLPIARIGDALVAGTDAFGRIAVDVLTGSRAEIGELREGKAAGRGGSSTLPGKHNPVLSVLVHRAALAAPGLAATLHLSAATANDDRPDGGWHAEWATIRTLARRTLTAADQTAELLAGLVVDRDAMAANLAKAEGIGGEQRSMADLAGAVMSENYRGASDLIVDAVLDRCRARRADHTAEEAQA